MLTQSTACYLCCDTGVVILEDRAGYDVVAWCWCAAGALRPERFVPIIKILDNSQIKEIIARNKEIGQERVESLAKNLVRLNDYRHGAGAKTGSRPGGVAGKTKG